ncbi:MAG: hypothetical protein RLN85_21400, partial [Pseudomonadales bacterium]
NVFQALFIQGQSGSEAGNTGTHNGNLHSLPGGSSYSDYLISQIKNGGRVKFTLPPITQYIMPL